MKTLHCQQTDRAAEAATAALPLIEPFLQNRQPHIASSTFLFFARTIAP